MNRRFLNGTACLLISIVLVAGSAAAEEAKSPEVAPDKIEAQAPTAPEEAVKRAETESSLELQTPACAPLPGLPTRRLSPSRPGSPAAASSMGMPAR